MNKDHSQLGMHYLDLETPALLVDLAAMERNLRLVADFFATVPANLRPHVKNHRTPALAQLQIAAGAVGICCGNLAEAEIMIDAGIDDVLITKEIVRPDQIARVADLAGRSAIKVIVDDYMVALKINQAAQVAGTRVGVLVDVDVRLGRSGVAPGEAARHLSQAIAKMRGLQYLGLMGYEGSMQPLSAAEREQECRRVLGALVETKQLIEGDGIAVPIVSTGAASTYRVAGAFPGVTEVQAGAYLLSDVRYRRTLPEFACALSALATVISRPSPARVTIDAGQKKLASDGGMPEPKLAALRVVALNEEHGLLDLEDVSDPFRVGDVLEITPWHGSTTINLYEHIYAIRDEHVEAIWEVSARGM
jgi:D-serine deaminase-like pyridoxal phosphate-dependent protein